MLDAVTLMDEETRHFAAYKDVRHDDFPWCHVEWMSDAALVGARQLMLVRATFEPGAGHPGRDRFDVDGADLRYAEVADALIGGHEQIPRLPQIVLGPEGAGFGVADVAAEARRRVPVAADPDIIGLQIVIAGKCARPFLREHRSPAHAGVTRHPVGIEVADRIVGAALRHRQSIEFDRHRALELARVPERQAGGRFDVDHVAKGDERRLLGFDLPLRARGRPRDASPEQQTGASDHRKRQPVHQKFARKPTKKRRPE